MKYLKYLFLLAVITACKKEEEVLNSPLEDISFELKNDQVFSLSDSKENTEGVYMFTNKEKTIACWTEWHKDSAKNILNFAYFNTQTNRFDKAISVKESLGLQMHAESMAKIGITKKGALYAVYRRKSKNSKSRFGGKLYYSISENKGKTWSAEKHLVSNENSASQSFFDIAILSDGELGIIWLDSRKPIHKNRSGKTLFFAKTKNNVGFVSEKPIAGSTCECCRTELFVDKLGNIHVAYRNKIEKGEYFYNDSFGQSQIETRDMFYTMSSDNGKSFSPTIPVSLDNWYIQGCPHTGPSLASSSDGNLGAAWFTGANEAGMFFTKKNKNDFNDKLLIDKDGKHPQMIAVNNKYYITYEVYYEKEGKGYSKINLKTIENNKIISSSEISKPLTDNNHPVLIKIDNKKILIAWVNTDVRTPKICYRLLNT